MSKSPVAASAYVETPAFVETSEHRRFAELCDAVRRYRYIGVCYGPPGVGKTISAHYYAGWDVVGPFLSSRDQALQPAPLAAIERRTVVYTPPVSNSPRRLELELYELCRGLDIAIGMTLFDPLQPVGNRHAPTRRLHPNLELIIVDEADRLRQPALEQLRDHHDRRGLGLVLIGMPGIERRLARYAQFYSRVGFAHEYHRLGEPDLGIVIQQHWEAIGAPLRADDPETLEALAAIRRATQGNFQLVHRLFAQIHRILEVNDMAVITHEVVDAARESLVIGTS